MNHPCIGILAGMGPRSTAPFYDMVVNECVSQYGAKYDTDFPAMLIYSLPTPFYADRPIDHEALSGAIMSGLKELAGCGVDFIVMPCNIAHMYYDELRRRVNVPLLNIVDETVSRIPPQNKNIALFAARGTAESGIYQRGIEESGKALVYKPEWQDSIDALILAVKERGVNEANIETIAELLSDANLSVADCAIIGCTDLTPLALACDAEIEILDSAKCLANATVGQYIKLKGNSNI